MNKITLYTIPYCPFCIRAKELLKKRGISFEEIDVSEDDALRDELAIKFTHDTVPLIVRGEEFIGGFTELQKMDENGLLS